jgi:hypothetical protein
MKMLSYHLKIDRCYIDERAIKSFIPFMSFHGVYAVYTQFIYSNRTM